MKIKLLHLIWVFTFSILSSQAGMSKKEGLPKMKCAESIFDGAIEGLVLVDADTNEDVYELRDGLEIDFELIKDRKLNIRLKILPWAHIPNIKRVDFKLDGPVSANRSEFVIPFAVFGDINGNYDGRNFIKGDYSIWVGVDDNPRTDHYWDVRTINFSVMDVTHKIAGFYKIESDNNFINNKIENGDVIDYSDNPLSFEARPGTFKVGSMVLELTGPVTYSATENVEPFTLFGDSNGEFNGQILPEGEYTLTATPYAEAYEKGKTGIPLTITFKVEFNKSSFSLSFFMNMIDADSGKNLETIFINDPKVIDNKDIATNNVNFVVHTNSSAIKSVYMAMQGPVATFENFVQPSHIQIENIDPYAMFGDIDGVFNGRALQPGLYRITATPYAGENATGNAGFGERFEFEIIDSGSFLKAAKVLENNKAITLYPNPSRGRVMIQAGDNAVIRKATVLDIFGKKVFEYPQPIDSEQGLDLNGLLKGLYFVRFNTEKGQETKKLVLQ